MFVNVVQNAFDA